MEIKCCFSELLHQICTSAVTQTPPLTSPGLSGSAEACEQEAAPRSDLSACSDGFELPSSAWKTIPTPLDPPTPRCPTSYLIPDTSRAPPSFRRRGERSHGG